MKFYKMVMNLKERIEHLGLSETFDWVMENNRSKDLSTSSNKG